MSKTLEKNLSTGLSQLLKDLKGKEKVEEHIRLCLSFMRKQLSGKEGASRDFWEARRLCLDCFKKQLPLQHRRALWLEYRELADQIRFAQGVLDEKASFTFEQIELALMALESELKDFDQRLANIEEIELPKEAKILYQNFHEYVQGQKELDLLTLLGRRLSGLRLELMQTTMPKGKKSSLFKKLANLGRGIYPRRRGLVAKLSELFLSDVEAFVKSPVKDQKRLLFAEKDEIKALHFAAKILTIDPPTFSKVREVLNIRWEVIKERMKESQTQRAIDRKEGLEQLGKVSAKIEEFEEACKSQTLNLVAADKRGMELVEELSTLKISKEGMKIAKRRIDLAKKPMEEEARVAREREKEAERLRQKKEEKELDTLLSETEKVASQAEGMALEALVEKWEGLVKRDKRIKIEDFNREYVKGQIDAIFDHVQEKKWQRFQQNGDRDKAPLHNLLEERHKAHRLLKGLLEKYRKQMGRSGMSVEYSLCLQKLISGGKIRLDAITTTIEEIEERLFDMEE